MGRKGRGRGAKEKRKKERKTYSVFLKITQDMKDKKTLKTYSKWKTTNETLQVNATCDVIPERIVNLKEFKSYQGQYLANGKSSNGSVDYVVQFYGY